MHFVSKKSIERDNTVLEELTEKNIAKILIVGGSGFVASGLIDYLGRLNSKRDNSDSLNIRVLSRSTVPRGQHLTKVEVQRHPQKSSLKQFYVDFAPNVVYYISRLNNPCGKTTVDDNLEFLNSHLDAIMSSPTMPKLIYMSSGAVYGNVEVKEDNLPFQEDQQRASTNMSDYARVKIESEKLIERRLGKSSPDYLLARLFAFFGPGLPLKNFAIGNFMDAKVQKIPIQIKGTGDTVRSYMYVDDLAAALTRLAASGDGILNIGGDIPLTLRELAKLFEEIFGCSIEVLGQAGFDSYYVPDISKIEKILGATNHVSLREGLLLWSNRLGKIH